MSNFLSSPRGINWYQWTVGEPYYMLELTLPCVGLASHLQGEVIHQDASCYGNPATAGYVAWVYLYVCPWLLLSCTRQSFGKCVVQWFVDEILVTKHSTVKFWAKSNGSSVLLPAGQKLRSKLSLVLQFDSLVFLFVFLSSLSMKNQLVYNTINVMVILFARQILSF